MSPLRRRAIAVLVAGGAVVGLATCRPGGGGGNAPAAPSATLVVPLNDAVVGEEVRLRRGRSIWTWRVSHSTDDAVQVEFVETTEGGGPAGVSPPPAQSHVWPRNGFGLPEGLVVRRIDRDRIEVAGRWWDCWRLQCHSRAGTRFYWITDEVPVHGVLRIAPDLDGDGQPDPGTQADLLPDGGR